MIKRREKTKRENVHLGVEIFEKRYQARDFNGHILAEFTSSAVKSSRYHTFNQNYEHSTVVNFNNFGFVSGLVGLHLRQFMVINTQANNRHGQMPVRSIIRWLLATMHRPVRHRSINVAVPMVIPPSPTMFERRSVNTRNGSIKIHATNRHIQRLVIFHSFRSPKFASKIFLFLLLLKR